MQSCRARHPAERWQYEFDLHVAPQRGSCGSQYKHPAMTNVYAVAGVVVAPAVGPAEQEWQSYLKPTGIPSLDGVVHIRTQFPSAGMLTISTPQELHKRVMVFWKAGRAGN